MFKLLSTASEKLPAHGQQSGKANEDVARLAGLQLREERSANEDECHDKQNSWIARQSHAEAIARPRYKMLSSANPRVTSKSMGLPRQLSAGGQSRPEYGNNVIRGVNHMAAARSMESTVRSNGVTARAFAS